MSAETRAKDIFLDALEVDAGERADFLGAACAGDPALRAAVDALLSAHARADSVLGDGDTSRGSSAMAAMASRALADLDLSPGDLVGDYRLEDELGEGGFGRVFRAEQLRPVRRRVALKLLKLGMDSRQVVARFEAERHVLARMEHPHVARVFDAGATPEGRPFFAMELVDGEPITDYCRRRALALAPRLELFHLVCLAIQHAHAKGVLHRDVKPNNVLVTEVDGEAQPRVIDFGVAKAIEGDELDVGQLTLEGHLVGTPAYMSPEQMDTAGDVDTRSDVYALGVLLYELIAGAPPFAPEGTGIAAFVDLRRKIREEDPTPPSRAATGAGGMAGAVPSDVDWVCLRALQRDRESRYPTAFELAAEIERLLAGQPVEAAPPSRVYRLRKLIRRHRTASFFALSALLALLLGAVGTTIQKIRAERLNVALGAALARVEQEAAEASAQFEIAEAVNRFLTRDLLTAAKPSLVEGRGRDVMMSQVLEAAATSVDRAAEPGGRFAGKPRVEGRVRHAIGQTQVALGRSEEASAQLELALELLRSELGERHPESLRCVVDLAEARYRLDEDEAADALLEPLVSVLREVLGPADQMTLTALKIRASCVRSAGRSEESAAMLAEGLDAAREAGIERTTLAAGLLQGLAIVRAEALDFDQAERLFREAIEIRIETDGPDARATLVAQSNLAIMLGRAGRSTDALALLEGVLPRLRELLGDDHPDALSAIRTLANLYVESGRPSEAADLARAVYEVTLERYGPDHPETLLSMDPLGIAIGAEGDFDGARRVMLELVERSEQRIGRVHPTTAGRIANLGIFLWENGRYEEAEPYLRRALSLNDRFYGEAHRFSLLTLTLLANARREQGDEVEAELLLLEALERSAELPGATAEVLAIRLDLGQLCRDQERWEEAIELFETSCDELLAERGAADDDYLSTRARIMDTLVRAGWLDDARAMEAELLPYLEALETPGDIRRPPE